MIKKIAWDTFKKTGNINTFMEFKHFSQVEESVQKDVISDKKKAEQYGDNKNKWDNYFGA